ncbi:hypothetical protein [Gilvimarinus polysaccharolyticus]|uniref:hypothetical protein n=1 Tax=Gilvimarinus polysaccharolyticus TaxID=863921 RepID=UPI000673B347|nr:hypothetical protein [Gilvimarinus polysaccharolyticus]
MYSLYSTGSRVFNIAIVLLGAAVFHSTAAPITEQENTEKKSPDIIGEAFRQGSNELLYRERHQYTINASDQLEHNVTYTQPNGAPLAYKKISYNDQATAPSFELTDSLNNETLRVNIAEKIISIAYAKNDVLQESKLDIKQPLVVDAGFDPFVQNNWESLSRGNSEEFYFLLPRREKLVELRLTSHTCSDVKPDTHLCLSLEINNWLLRILVDPIELTYQREGRRLTRYLGVSNLSFPDEEDTPQVDIHYQPASEKYHD